jgi:hypothetical protein
MSDTPLSMTAIQNALKYWYLDGMRYQINEAASPFAAQLERTSEHVEGYKIKMPLSYGVTGGIGMRTDTGTLPTVNPRKFVQAEWETLNCYVKIQVTDKAIQASRSNRGAFIAALTHDMEAAERDAKRDYSRQIMGDGTGKLATVSAVSSEDTTHTVTLDTDGSKIKFFNVGMLIDVYTAETRDTSEAEVISVDKDNNQIVFVASTAPEAEDVIYLAGNKDGELTGLEKVLTADNTIYNINRSTSKWFNPTVKAVTGEISEIKIQEGIDDAEDDAGNTIDFLMAEKGVVRAYKNLLGAQKAIVNTIEIKGGFRAVSFNGIPLVGDKYCPNGTLYALSMKNWKFYEMADWEWMAEDGNILFRNTNTPVYNAVLRKYADLGCDLPRGQVKFTGITRH